MTPIKCDFGIAHLPFAALSVDTSGKIIEVNDRLEQLTGYSCKELHGSDIENLLFKEVISSYTLYQQKSDQHPHTSAFSYLIELPLKSKQTLNCQVKVSEINNGYLLCLEYQEGDPIKMSASIKEVTQEQKLITQLKKQNRYLHLAERLNQSGHWRLDLKQDQLYWSKGIYIIHGVRPGQYQPEIASAIDFYLKEEQERIQQLLDDAIEYKKSFHFKSTIINAQRKRVQVECIGEVELNDNEQVVAIFGVFKDITQTVETYEKLKLLSKVNYTIKVPIFFIDEADKVVYQELSSQMASEGIGLFDYINFSIKDYLRYKGLAKEQGQIKQANISFDNYISVFDLQVVFESEEGLYIWIVENTTENYRKEQQQIISNRLALLGNTFGNVSHDINNVLGVALGATEMLELKVAHGSQDIGKYIDRVKNAIDKGKNVTERLLAFTRKPAVKIIEFDPIQEIKENQYLFKQLLLNTIDFQCQFDDIHCQIKFPQGEFINILLNLVLNAQDAIQEQGLIGTIVMSVGLNEQKMLEIHVKDSGVGIEQENLAKIFDPFYSSKLVNKGNGIGLANVYGTIHKYNGEVLAKGQCDLGGAEFILAFPCRVFEQQVNTCKQKKTKMAMSEKSVLVLDDETSIGEFVALFLASKGAATEYVQSKESLLKVLACDCVFDVFITDMILPDISGREAVELVQEKFPEIKVYSISGYIAEEDNKWQHPVLRKPFNSEELADFLTNN
ncbi:hypothetical protein tinsulaeT_01570 [Thalassotalea insulae]|uniref:histidine kinase n=1 Tax=Thalassotalea insulae TaxID=2056778 RepID=A0ABQ6GQI6_9GAMM|nr:ATP-binding protein [Thalassotalea insulae]GLX76817.1 hypothetical protein tinsulaeT_01570 [Thalassotalea insulae]